MKLQFSGLRTSLIIRSQTVLVVGSANTAFDVLEDCYNAGLKVTMNVRSAPVSGSWITDPFPLPSVSF